MRDEVIRTEKGSVLQHGKFNDRIYLMKLSGDDIPGIIDTLNELAQHNKYGKITARVPLWALPLFKADGYITEAYLPGYIKGEEDIHYVSKFLNSDRLMYLETDMLVKLSDILHKNKGEKLHKKLPEYHITKIGEDDAGEVADLFKQVFSTYPFPIHDPQFILASMRANTMYFGIKGDDGRYIAISSAEIEPDKLAAEMTDFAVLKSQRGKKLSIVLLKEMEKEMRDMNIRTLYTIARLNSPPMNKTFLRMGYKYTGTLIKNTNIAGSIESMNILFKSLK